MSAKPRFPPKKIPPAPRSLEREFLFLFGAALLIGAFYASCLTVETTRDERARTGEKRGYLSWNHYPLMVEGWLHGRLDLPIEVPARLLTLPDPYDPDANKRYRFAGEDKGVHDLLFYHGRLYMYWGPTPALVAFLPWRLITGQPLSTAWATWAFALTGYLASAWLLLRIVRRHFSTLSLFCVALSLLALGICNWAPVVLRRPNVWEVPIAAAFCFGAIAWWCLAEALWSSQGKTKWLAAASLANGLAMAARPTWLLGAFILLVPLLPGLARMAATDLLAARSGGLGAGGLRRTGFARPERTAVRHCF